MHTRTRNSIVVGVLGAALAAGLVATERDRSKSPLPGGRALDAVPAGAILVATADLAALRAAGAFGAVLARGREIQGVGKVKDLCGFDPIEQIDEVAFAIPASGDPGEFGLVAAGRFDDEAIVACATKVVEARKGKPVTTPLGPFRSVHDGNGAGGGEIAVKRGGGLMLLGGGAYLRAMVDAAEGRVPSVRTSPGHAELARSVGDGAVRVTFVLTPAQRASMPGSLASQGSTIAGGALAIALSTQVSVHATLRCDTAPACADVAHALDTAKRERAGDIGVRAFGFGGLLDRVTVDAEGLYVHARVALPPDEAATLLDTALKLRGFRHPMPGDAPAEAEPGSPAPSAPAPPATAAPPAPAPASASASAPPPSAPSASASASARAKP